VVDRRPLRIARDAVCARLVGACVVDGTV